MKFFEKSLLVRVLMTGLFVLMATGLSHSYDGHEAAAECETCLHIESFSSELTSHVVFVAPRVNQNLGNVGAAKHFLPSVPATYKSLRAPPQG